MGVIQNAVLNVASDVARLGRWSTEMSIQKERNEAQKKYFDLVSEEKLKQEQQKTVYQEKVNKEKLKKQRALNRIEIAEKKEKAAALKSQAAAMGNGRAMLQTDFQSIQREALNNRLAMTGVKL